MTLLSRDEQEVALLVAEAQRRQLPVPDEAEHYLLRQEAVRRGLLPWTNFAGYVQDVNPTLYDFEHTPIMVHTAERFMEGDITRLLVLMPPRYLKTEVFGRLLLSYYLRKHPTQEVAFSSHGASRAWEVSEDVQDYFLQSGGKLRSGTTAKKFWGLPEGGQLWAVGMGETFLGKGFNLGVCDDPMDPEKILSPTYQRRFQRWWPSKWLGRQEPGGRVCVVMQRLGMDDPIDFLFRREVGENTEAAPEHWHVLVMDEIKSDEPLGRWGGERGLPKTCTLIPDHRKSGTLLAPSRFSRDQVEKMQTTVGPYVTAVQRQQRPMRPTGEFWKKDWFMKYTDLPRTAYDGGRDWDTAYSDDEENAASAWVQSYRGPSAPQNPKEFPIYIHDVDWDWLEFPGLVEWIKGLDGPHYVEAKASGKSVVQVLGTYSISAKEVPVKGDKLARASAAQPTVSNKRIYVRQEIYDRLLFGEQQGLLRITAEMLQANGKGLDLNDAFVQVIHRHLGLGAMAKRQAGAW